MSDKPPNVIGAQGDALRVELFYPREPENFQAIIVGLSDVRAADDIRVTYDFERDGWKIEQAAVFEWSGNDEVCDPEWAEVAFVKAWARERKEPDEH